MSTLRSTLVPLAAAGVLAALVSASTPAASTAGPVAPTAGPVAPTAGTPFDPAQFTHPVQNAYFPLVPGLVTRLHGTEDGETFRQKVRVTHRTELVAGVRVTVVRDVVHRLDGTLAEATDDWYAADDAGNVWYFGEDTATYDEHGQLEDREGSWRAGRHGAEPGIVMPAVARPSRATFQEHARGVAEDQGWIVQHLAQARTPGGRFRDVVRAFEWSRLEPDVVSQKLYAAGIGIIAERDLAGGDEHFWVVAHTRAS